LTAVYRMRTGLVMDSGDLNRASIFLQELTHRYSRIAVTGRPGIGKTYAIRPAIQDLEERGFAVESSDELVLGYSWDDQVKRLLAWADPKERWLLEGVTVARALRHGLTAQAVVTFHGSPLRPKLTPAALRLGDSVYKWVDEAKRILPNVTFYEWHVNERKFG
jgi:predicted ATPase